MPTIDTVDCDFVRGVFPEYLDQQTARWHVPGTDGEGLMLLGKAGAPCKFTAVKYGTNAELQTWQVDLKILEGSLVTIENDWEDSAEVYLVRVGPVQKRAVKCPDEDWEARGECELDCLRVSD